MKVKVGVLDIISDRKLHKLFDYFRGIKRKVKNNVKFFVSDMWPTYKTVKDVYFKNAKFIVYKYHWIRQMNWAFEDARKEEQI